MDRREREREKESLIPADVRESGRLLWSGRLGLVVNGAGDDECCGWFKKKVLSKVGIEN